MLRFLYTLFFIGFFSMEAAEIRAIINDSTIARERLINQGSIYRGDYAFTDHVYFNRSSGKSLNDEFFRIREYQLTNWAQKAVVATHKVRDSHGEKSKVVFQEEYDTLLRAQEHIPVTFSRNGSFSRCGWEYSLEGMRIFVEEIEGLPPSIEVIAAKQEEIFSLFDNIEIVEVLTESVPELYFKQYPFGEFDEQ